MPAPDCRPPEGPYEWFDVEPALACQPPAAQEPYVHYRGCEFGCRPCRADDRNDIFALSNGVYICGRRWTRPTTIGTDVIDIRNARGRAPFLLSNRPQRFVSPGGHQDLSMCFQQWPRDPELPPGEPYGWAEFWDLNICDCTWMGTPGSPSTRGCFSTSCLSSWRWTTCHWMTGWFPPEFHCTGRELGAGPQQVAFLDPDADHIAFVRVGRNSHGCAVSFNTLCWGHKVPITNDRCRGYGTFDPGYWAGNTIAQLFNLLEVDSIGCQYRGDGAMVRAKNAALAWVDAHRTSMPERLDGAAQNLDKLDRDQADDRHFFRYYNTHTPGHVPLGMLPAVVTWPNCVIERANVPITVDYCVWAANIDLQLIVVREWSQEDRCPDVPSMHDEQSNVARLVAKLHVDLFMAIRASWPGEAPAGLFIEHRDNVSNPRHRYPLIVDADGNVVDRILYRDNEGEWFCDLPPMTVPWQGEFNPLIDGYEDVDLMDHGHNYPDQATYRCLALWDGMVNVSIPGRYTHPHLTGEDRRQVYTGEFVFSRGNA